MDTLDKAYETMRQHAQDTSGQIEHHLVQEKQKIETLSGRILAEMQQAMNFNVAQNPLQNLEKLDKLERLDGISNTLNNILQTADSFRANSSQEHKPADPERHKAEKKRGFSLFSLFKRRRHARKD
jgi:hypothetical protein